MRIVFGPGVSSAAVLVGSMAKQDAEMEASLTITLREGLDDVGLNCLEIRRLWWDAGSLASYGCRLA